MTLLTKQSTPRHSQSPLQLLFSGSKFLPFLQDETGQDLIEYALVAALIGLGATIALRGLSTKIGASFNSVGSTLTSST